MQQRSTSGLSQWISEHKWLEAELSEHYHYLHQHPEVGSHLPVTSRYVCQKLRSWGYDPIILGDSGICALVGPIGQKTLLLRADMDALPIKEETGLPFQSCNGAMHACGHDMHTSMLLGVARLLKLHEDQLNYCIKLMFQPHEEGLVGAQEMIDAGVLENPRPNAALAIHVEAGVEPCGTIRWRERETTASSTIFEIHVTGKSAHGAQPHNGIDPINGAAHIYLAFQELIARELPASSSNIITIGTFQAGNTHNIIPDHALLNCSLRSFHEEERAFILKRISQICQGIDQTFRTTTNITIRNSAPCVYNDPELTQTVIRHSEKLFGNALRYREHPLPVSEDFSRISKLIPSCFFTLATGGPADGYLYPQHSPKVTFDEHALIHGCCFLFHNAFHIFDE